MSKEVTAMAKRRVVFRKKRQNRLAMFLIMTVVLMILVVVSVKSVELKAKMAGRKTES